MAPARPDPLPVLNKMFNEVLVQTGKAFKAIPRDGSRNLSGANSAIHDRTQESLRTYQFALDDVESEILRAKAVLHRDLAKLQAARAPPREPTPPLDEEPLLQPAAATTTIEAPLAEMPSAAAHTINQPAFVPDHESAPIAPFPDMGMDMSSDIVDLTAQASQEVKTTSQVPVAPMQQHAGLSTVIKTENRNSPKPSVASHSNSVPPAPMGGALLKSDDPQSGHTAMPMGENQAPEFTNMQFSLDTSTTGVQNAPPAPMPAFDLTAFSSNDATADFPTEASFEPLGQDLNSALPSDPKNPSQNDPKLLDDVFTLDGGADSMDLDLDLGTGTVNDSTFDDLFLDAGDNSGMGQFDNAFFGLD